MYDILEVLFFHQASSDKRVALDNLREAFDGDFEVEEHEFVDESRQVIRIVAATEQFESASDFEAHLREMADEDEFQWKLIGAVPVGQTETVLA
ncbi:hypothetical protein PQR70_14040 [Paraburkholderia madseniana]|uniref:hypothetical protein n=1 Tax=Paraburkholderia madseniana TaxID=2599607 RepID=UPI0038BE07C1